MDMTLDEIQNARERMIRDIKGVAGANASEASIRRFVYWAAVAGYRIEKQPEPDNAR